jgi:hypothetical protein
MSKRPRLDCSPTSTITSLRPNCSPTSTIASLSPYYKSCDDDGCSGVINGDHWHCSDTACPTRGLLRNGAEFTCTNMTQARVHLLSHTTRDRKAQARTSDRLLSMQRKHESMDAKETVSSDYRRYTCKHQHTPLTCSFRDLPDADTGGDKLQW